MVPHFQNLSKGCKLETGRRSSDCCSWDGVECERDTGHVIDFNLASSCLCISINSSSGLFHLIHL
ncbi:hypothetical protein VitviT2T_018123 [Vitis vinifera]|uniref:Leucine-rich repeat-containing N-terminal plant-type domain-containing protein n=1 Tax=Vitis vinifera TaxID=29760 RepID=A0ABY9CWB8_VITVI|nr:hypothetical protein VitviT2T_018123 [Vitis vinifera]